MTDDELNEAARRPHAADAPRLVAELKRARRVLRFYADPATYSWDTTHVPHMPIASDRGRRARYALEHPAALFDDDEDTQQGEDA